MFYAGVSAGAPKQADLNLSKAEIQNYLTDGDNVLSVELHNDREASSDIYFEFQNLTLNYNETDGNEPAALLRRRVYQRTR